MTTRRDDLGGIIHTYQKYDPVEFPSPTAPPPDLVSPAFEHLLAYGSFRELTEEELANAIRIDPRQISGFMLPIDALREMLQERKRKILETYETDTVQRTAHDDFHTPAREVKAPLLANMTEFGKGPNLSVAELGAMGYAMVLFPLTAFRVAMKATEEALRVLHAAGLRLRLGRAGRAVPARCAIVAPIGIAVS